MTEFQDLKQHEDGFRRLFFDANFELYVWYDRRGGRFTGFQLVYDRQTDPHALTWLEGEGYGHNLIDDGETRRDAYKSTPILVPDGNFDKGTVSDRFERASAGLDPTIQSYVLEKLRAYSAKDLNPLM